MMIFPSRTTMFSKKVQNRQTTDRQTDRQTDTVLIGQLKRATWNPKFDPCEKAHSAESSVTKDDLTEPKQFPSQPSFFLGIMENTTVVTQVFEG